MHLRYNIVDLDDIQEAGRLMAVRQNANVGAKMAVGAADLAARILALPEDKRKFLAALL
jgi:hypothetical protein